MALLGEEVVVEWLNRDGYFTIRGIKIGRNEIDILAIKPLAEGGHHCRHIEIQLSPHPIGYITRRGLKEPSNVELDKAVNDWVEKKFNGFKGCVQKLRQDICPQEWTRELVVWNVKFEHEIEALRHHIRIWRLDHIVKNMIQDKKRKKSPYSATGAALFDLMMLFAKEGSRTGETN